MRRTTAPAAPLALAVALLLAAAAALPRADAAQYTLYIQNKCYRSIDLAVFYDIPGNGWTIRSWYPLSIGEKAGPFYSDNPRFRFFAQTVNSGARITWGGRRDCSNCYFGTRGGREYPFSDTKFMTSSVFTHQLTC